MRALIPGLDLSTIAGAGLIVYAAIGLWTGKLPADTAWQWLGAGVTLVALPQRRTVPTVQTARGEAVPVAPAPPPAPPHTHV